MVTSGNADGHARDQRSQEGSRTAAPGPDDQGADNGVVGGPGRVDGAGLRGEQLLCVLSHHPAGIGEDQVATRPLDQTDPQGRLERSEVL